MFYHRQTAAQEQAWMDAQARDSTFGKVYALASHAPLFAAAGRAWHKRFYGESLMILYAAFTSLDYHLCAMYDVCGGVEPGAAHSADRFTATLMAFALASISLTLRDAGPRLVSDLMSASGFDTTRPPPASVVQSLDKRVASDRPVKARVHDLLDVILGHEPVGHTAERTGLVIEPEAQTRPVAAFKTVDDIPVYATLHFTELVVVLNIVGLALAAHFFEGGLYAAYVALILIALDFVVYVALFRPIPPHRLAPDGTLLPPLPATRYAKDWGVATLVLLLTSLVLYAVGDMSDRISTIPHSTWHVTAALMLMCAMETVTSAASRD